MTTEYLVGLTPDVLRADGSVFFGDVGLDRLTDAGLRWEVMPAQSGHVASGLEPYDAVLSFGHLHFTREAVAAAPRLRHVARFGAGYDGIDLDGLAAEGVLVTNAPDGVRRPLALAALTLVLALGHRLLENHRAATEGRWSARGDHRGLGIAGRTVGIIGFGSVGAELAALLQPLGVHVLTLDRPSARERASAAGVECVPVERLAAESDYVVLTAALTPSSRHLVDDAFLRRMRPTAHLVNVGRGGLVDQVALTDALREGRLAGAGLDVLDPEPPAPDEPLLALDNVIVTPHALCWTDDFVSAVARSATDAVIDVAHGRRPAHPLNPAALTHPRNTRA
ncbi:2-hydroxyacid dehydrogenase [Cellulomonas timonensis]|uniref:2-hydroxyacid dehydrogenase n=1 Tax=Cellulomonas timonensis TaxID=1689271 RepID=UPI00082E0470|nr:NAD(P)-dependent oxidoreductase [Cellulomonas timonensis]